MIYANLSRRCQKQVEVGIATINKMKEKGDYFNAIKGLTELMEMFEEDKEFYKLIENLRDVAKDLWRKRLIKQSSIAS